MSEEDKPVQTIDAIAGTWPVRRSTVLDWLMFETSDERFIDNILVTMCLKLASAGVPVARSSVHFRIQHPQWIGTRIGWRKGSAKAEIETFDYNIVDSPDYIDSPVSEIHSGAGEVRKNLKMLPAGTAAHPIYAKLKAEGITDYVAWPLYHTLGRRHVVTFGTDHPGGFSKEDIRLLSDLVPAFAIVSEVRLKNRLARTLLETYVGPHASEQILAGATTRGSSATVSAAILISDLRHFASLSNHWPRDDVIAMLNSYFDAMAEPIARHGGEILKFMGDGLLAIFPLNSPSACADLILAIGEAEDAMDVLNERHRTEGRPKLHYGIGVHVGDVMYGNIGSSNRLDFTVIGPAVNVAARLETLSKELGRPVLLSRAFIDIAPDPHRFDYLGAYPLRGLGEPVEVFTLPRHTTV
ncbi:adenylate/guanylate cyclase domain-containing protein [Mesorhizobium sp. B2-3-5]|uniref:adenylate/guanylate cyclase domain-containing protein n=1 Tax=Mesorhizobium sp. B2-3-5 TaxID=2589958 RepID=UPI00112831BE|nr:adenylate/guanylate cyclase domain-containing protein [Mesorhizobium sp. B2-3-5]TPM26893.1 adenylate/guanylate cyclase domain-containing protein [Mesorhizobium sp. B2-3-5]